MNLKKKEKSNDLPLALVFFMNLLIDTILNDIPEKYSVEMKELSKDLWSEFELELLEKEIVNMIRTNKEKKVKKFNESISIIKKSDNLIHPIKIIQSLENLGFINKLKSGFEEDPAFKIANEAVNEHLNNEIFKDARKILTELDRDTLKELNNEIIETTNQISKEVGRSQEIKQSISEQRKKTQMYIIMRCRQGRGYSQYC